MAAGRELKSLILEGRWAVLTISPKYSLPESTPAGRNGLDVMSLSYVGFTRVYSAHPREAGFTALRGLTLLLRGAQENTTVDNGLVDISRPLQLTKAPKEDTINTTESESKGLFGSSYTQPQLLISDWSAITFTNGNPVRVMTSPFQLKSDWQCFVHSSLDSCIFCKIIKGDLPSFKLIETEHTLAFLDIYPISKGHALVIPKYHAEKLHEVPDEYLQDTLVVAKKIALALGCENYNILENNGSIAHQYVFHVHFHVIPKPSSSNTEGLVIDWPIQTSITKEDLQALHAQLQSKL